MRPVVPAVRRAASQDAFILRGAVTEACSSPFPALVSHRVAAPGRAVVCEDQMKLIPSPATLPSLVLLHATMALHASADNYAVATRDYHPGTGTPAGYDIPSAITGAPSRETPGEYGGPVDPFSAPWQPSQLLAVGAGGSVTASFNPPILDLASHPFGIDFMVFTSAAFIIANGDYSGGGITDGTLFGDNQGSTRVLVSPDDTHFYVLDPALAPTVDGYFPSDGAGDFSTPVNPALGGSDFAGLTLDGIRSKYGGSAGGTGYDIAWARDESGKPVVLDQVKSVRIDVLSGRADIDGFSVVPEPGVTALGLAGIATCSGRRLFRRISLLPSSLR